MERPQFLLIGIVAIAVAFFAMRFTGRSDSDLGYDSGERLAMGGGADGGFEGGRYGSDGRSQAGRGRDGQGRLNGGGSGFAENRAGGGRNGGSASSLSVGSRERRGTVGQGGHGLGESGRGGGGLAALARESNSVAGAGAESGSKSDRMELLSGKQSDIDPFYEGADTDENPDDDVVLEVSTVDDADRKARDAVNVEEGEDGVGLEVGEDSVLTFPNAGNVNADHGSIALDITPSWAGSDPTDNSFMQLRTQHEWNNRMQLVKNGPFLRFILTDDTGREADISYRIDHWEPGETYKVTATYGEGQTNLYVNGQRVGSNQYEGQFQIPPGTPLYLASDLPGGSYKGANARVKARVYNRALAADEIF